MSPGTMSHGKTPAFYGHLDKSVVIFENEQGRTLAGTKSRCDLLLHTVVP